MALLYGLIATVIVSLISLIGVFTLALNEKKMRNILLLLVAISAGALIGGAFLHLIPESVENLGIENVGIGVIIGFVIFFILERGLHWHHCHKGNCDVHMFTYMSLVGDSIHNFIDGLVIMGAFMTDFSLGIVTTLAVIAHEIPQELGDFGVLIYGGFSRTKALLFNFLTALTAVLGALIGYLIAGVSDSFIPWLIPIAAGGFIYIGASDLVPELHKEPNTKKAMISFIFFCIGILAMWGIKFIFEG